MSKYSLNDVIRQDIESMLMMTYTSIPAIVKSHNTTNQTLKVKVAVETPTYDGSNIPAVELEDVPVMFPQGSDWVIAGKLEEGDAVLLVVPHYGIEEYLQGSKGKEGRPSSVRRHDLNEAVAIPGMFTFKEPTRKLALKDKFHIAQGENNHITFDDSGVIITSGSSVVTVNNGTVSIDSSTINLTGNVNITGSLTTNGIDFSTHIHPYTDDGNPAVTGAPQ